LSAERLAAIVLLPGEAGAEAAELMASAIDPSVALRPVIFAPEVRGKAFFECQGDAARRLDATWASAVAGQVIPVFIATHELAFEQWVPGLDGLAFIAVEDEEVARNYRAMGARVHALVSRDTRNLIAAVISRLAELGLRGFTAVATTAEKRSSDASELTVAVPVVAAPRASDLGETRAVVPAGAHLPQVAATRLAPPPLPSSTWRKLRSLWSTSNPARRAARVQGMSQPAPCRSICAPPSSPDSSGRGGSERLHRASWGAAFCR